MGITVRFATLHTQQGFVRKNKAAVTECVRADGGHRDGTILRVKDWSASGKVVGGEEPVGVEKMRPSASVVSDVFGFLHKQPSLKQVD